MAKLAVNVKAVSTKNPFPFVFAPAELPLRLVTVTLFYTT